MAQQTATTAVGLELGGDDGVDGRLVSTASTRARPRAAVIAMPRPQLFSPRLADGCFSPAMHKPSRSKPAASAALLLLYGIGRPPGPSDRTALAVRAIGFRGNEWRISSDPPPLRRDRFQRELFRLTT